jgi:hypothetical protein
MGRPLADQGFATAANIKGSYAFPAAHTMPTLAHGTSCKVSLSPYIGNCALDLAGELLAHMYAGSRLATVPERPSCFTQLSSGSGALAPKVPMVAANLLTFAQAPFMPTLWTTAKASMAVSGFVYVPTSCQQAGATCGVHMAYHGCLQAVQHVKAEYATFAGYNEWAEANGLIVVYPQAMSIMLTNPNGCWDWFGYLGTHECPRSPRVQHPRDVL